MAWEEEKAAFLISLDRILNYLKPPDSEMAAPPAVDLNCSSLIGALMSRMSIVERELISVSSRLQSLGLLGSPVAQPSMPVDPTPVTSSWSKVVGRKTNSMRPRPTDGIAHAPKPSLPVNRPRCPPGPAADMRTTIKSRPKKDPITICTGPASTHLTPRRRYVAVRLWKLSADTKVDDIINYIKTVPTLSPFSENITVECLPNARSPTFKLSFPKEILSLVLDSNCWPSYVHMQRHYTPKNPRLPLSAPVPAPLDTSTSKSLPSIITPISISPKTSLPPVHLTSMNAHQKTSCKQRVNTSVLPIVNVGHIDMLADNIRPSDIVSPVNTVPICTDVVSAGNTENPSPLVPRHSSMTDVSLTDVTVNSDQTVILKGPVISDMDTPDTTFLKVVDDCASLVDDLDRSALPTKPRVRTRVLRSADPKTRSKTAQ
jgi:hypothetical protein